MEHIALEIIRKIFIIVIQILGFILFLLGISVWLTNGHILNLNNKNKIHDTIYIYK
jgi:hypothetical protein